MPKAGYGKSERIRIPRSIRRLETWELLCMFFSDRNPVLKRHPSLSRAKYIPDSTSGTGETILINISSSDCFIDIRKAILRRRMPSGIPQGNPDGFAHLQTRQQVEMKYLIWKHTFSDQQQSLWADGSEREIFRIPRVMFPSFEKRGEIPSHRRS